MIGTLLAGKWRIDACLGEGGMATVYAATHRNGSRVAIKMLRGAYARDPEARDRFLREGYAANSIGHVGVVKVLDDHIDPDGTAFMIMELLEGETLEDRRARLGGALPVDEVFSAGEQLLDLLAVAHTKGIIHRDIKPDNVFVTKSGTLKLFDFGVAQVRHASDEVTHRGRLLGTPEFMSPEQASGHPDLVDARADLWSVGATMFVLLSGQPVHITETLAEHIQAVATRPPRSVLTAAPGTPQALAAVIDRALALHKENRWPHARAMQQALRQAYQSATRGDHADEDTKYLMVAGYPEIPDELR